MSNVWHFVDGSCNADVLAEAIAMATPGRLICLGRPADFPPLPDGTPKLTLTQTSLRRRLGSAPGQGRILQCWSISCALEVAHAIDDRSAIFVLRLGHPPAAHDLACLHELAGRCRLTVACDSPLSVRQIEQVHVNCSPRTILPAGIDASTRRESLRGQYYFSDESIVLAAPCAVRPTSGHKYALWATAILAVAEFPVDLVIPHTGQPARDIESFGRQSGFSARLSLADRSAPDLAALADVVLLLDEDYLPSFPAVQAAWAGLPIVSSDTPSARALFGEGAHVLWVKPAQPRAIAQAILRLLEDRRLAERLGQAARQWALPQVAPAAVAGLWQDLYGHLWAKAAIMAG